MDGDTPDLEKHRPERLPSRGQFIAGLIMMALLLLASYAQLVLTAKQVGMSSTARQAIERIDQTTEKLEQTLTEVERTQKAVQETKEVIEQTKQDVETLRQDSQGGPPRGTEP